MLHYKALDELEEGIYILDANLTIKFINKAGEKILGVNRVNMINKNSDEYFGYPPNEVRLVERAIEEGREFTSDILPYKWGAYDKFMRVQTKLLKEHGEVIGGMAIFTEITDSIRLLPEHIFDKITPKKITSFIN
ncbi:PAS domain-containing protein [Aneurinibacillus sp. REN35]|uniref:PAS domain-containing protein n=1 Tax=Aneurinibacillus sp. REN35 TaxID=3237286 RepID=UPI003527D6B2